MEVDFNSFESILAAVDTRLVLNLSDDQDELVSSDRGKGKCYG
jgi:hypothetical protein